jgi:hypothetical protein
MKICEICNKKCDELTTIACKCCGLHIQRAVCFKCENKYVKLCAKYFGFRTKRLFKIKGL